MIRTMTRPMSQVFALVALTCCLVATAGAQRKALDRLPQDAEATTQVLPGDADPFEAIELPGKGRVRAIASGKSDLWLVRDELLVITVGDVLVTAAGPSKVRRRLAVPDGLLGLTADDEFFYVLAKHAIIVMDASEAREVRRIELPDNNKQDPVAIGAFGDELFISWPDYMIAVHKRTSKLRECRRPFPAPRWLSGDGQSFWRGGKSGFGLVDTSSRGRRLMSRALPEQFQGGLATLVGKRLLVVKSHDAAGKRIAAAFVDPQRTEPGEQLRISLRRGKQGLQYGVGPKSLTTANSVALELQRIANSPHCMVPGPAGKPVVVPALLVAYPGVTVAELAEAWDLVAAAGFAEVNCMSHNAKARPAESIPPPPPPPKPPVRKKR